MADRCLRGDGLRRGLRHPPRQAAGRGRPPLPGGGHVVVDHPGRRPLGRAWAPGALPTHHLALRGRRRRATGPALEPTLGGRPRHRLARRVLEFDHVGPLQRACGRGRQASRRHGDLARPRRRVDSSLRGLHAALLGVFAQDGMAKHLRKVAAADADERHLCLWLHRSGLPFAVADGLWTGTTLPPQPPPLPERVTHLWLMPQLGDRVLLWTPDDWQQHHPHRKEKATRPNPIGAIASRTCPAVRGSLPWSTIRPPR